MKTICTHTYQEHTPTSQPTLCLLITGKYHLESNPNFSHCLQSPMRSGPWIPFFIHYSSKLDFPRIFHYSKFISVLELLHFLFTIAVSIPSAWMFRPLTFPWLVSAQMSTSQRSLHLSYQSVISHYLKLSNSFFCIPVFPPLEYKLPLGRNLVCFFTAVFPEINWLLNKIIK